VFPVQQRNHSTFELSKRVAFQLDSSAFRDKV
jgi:hypothetical protein